MSLHVAVAADVAAALMWGPKSVHALMAIVTPTTHDPRVVQKHCDEFEAAGCCYVCDFTPRGKPVYAWNPKPFANASLPLPGQGEKR